MNETEDFHSEIASTYIDKFWDDHITPTLVEYIKIPCLSIDFDPDWSDHEYMTQVHQLAVNWLRQQVHPDWIIHDQTLPDKTPLILVEIPGDSEDTVLMYGHLDKQPEMEGWNDGYGPWKPVIHDGKLYGRGGADDGYALFASIAAIKALKRQQRPHSRIVILIEFSEESGSPHLPEYLDLYQAIIGEPDLVIALDSGTGDYERLWSTTSLRGMLSCNVTVSVLHEATHSGIASGIVPSSMRIMRQLLSRLEDEKTAEIRIPELNAEIPAQRKQQAVDAAALIGPNALDSFNCVKTLEVVNNDATELLLNNTWRPTLCVVGQDGMPATIDAGNVLRAYTRFKLSFRLPPNVDFNKVQPIIEKMLTERPPYGALISVEFDQGGNGWNAPELAEWLENANAEASSQFFGNDAAYVGLGASIPFMSLLGENFPKAQFLITGVLGPKSNAHGPNEFLHLAYAKKLTACVAYVLDRQFLKSVTG